MGRWISAYGPGLLVMVLVGCSGQSTTPPSTVSVPPPPGQVQLPSNPQPNPGRPIAQEPAIPADAIEVRFEGDAFSDLQVNDGVLVRGESLGWEDGRIRLVNATRYTGKRPSLTAPELAQAYRGNQQNADRMYRQQILIVRGVVTGQQTGKLYLSATATPNQIKPGKTLDLTQVKPDFQVAAREFRAAFDADAPSAGRKYEGKVVEIRGVVLRFENITGQAGILLEGPDSSGSAILYTQDDQPWSGLFPGQEVTVRGVGNPGAVSPVLSQCQVIARGDSPARTITASDLAREYGMGFGKANAKYGGKYLRVTGTVAGIQRGQSDSMVLQLQTGVATRILLRFGGRQEDYSVYNMKAGTPVQFLCRYTPCFDSRELTLDEPLWIHE